jgi:hypothetical protein
METETIAAIEADYSERAHRPITLEGLAGDWLAFADEVAAGYWGTIDDFTNDLTGRDLLERAVTRLSAADRAWLEGLTLPGDLRYQEVTTLDADDRLSGFFSHGDHWWWRRIPLVLGELEADLGGERS